MPSYLPLASNFSSPPTISSFTLRAASDTTTREKSTRESNQNNQNTFKLSHPTLTTKRDATFTLILGQQTITPYLFPTGCSSINSHQAETRGPIKSFLSNFGIMKRMKLMVGHTVASARETSFPARKGPSALARSSKVASWFCDADVRGGTNICTRWRCKKLHNPEHISPLKLLDFNTGGYMHEKIDRVNLPRVGFKFYIGFSIYTVSKDIESFKTPPRVETLRNTR